MLGKHLLIKGGIAAIACGVLGTGVAVAANASSSPQPNPTQSTTQAQQNPKHKGHRAGPLARMVHGQAVIPMPNGQFATATFDRGVVQSVNGSQLTLKEGTKKATYQTVTLNIAPQAVIRDNGKAAQLSDIKPGQMAGVIQAPGHERVTARNAPGS